MANARRLTHATLSRMDALLAFAAALIALRLAGLLARRWRATRRAGLAGGAWSLAAYAVAAAAIAWGEAAQWDGRAFRVYYAAGALVTVPLLGAGAALLPRRRPRAGGRLSAPRRRAPRGRGRRRRGRHRHRRRAGDARARRLSCARDPAGAGPR